MSRAVARREKRLVEPGGRPRGLPETPGGKVPLRRGASILGQADSPVDEFSTGDLQVVSSSVDGTGGGVLFVEFVLTWGG